MNKNFLAPFTDLLLKLKNTVSEDNPPITCIVADPFAPVAIRVGEEVGLPVVMYATVNAYLSDLSNGYLETKVDCAPGMKDTTDPDDVVFNCVMGAAATSVKARAIAFHTFDALEPEVLDGLSTIFPRVYSIGPLQLLLNQIEENGLKSIGYNLWKEDRASRGADALDDLPGFHFRTIPDGLPPSDIDATQDIPSLCDAMNKNFLAPSKIFF
uniref:Uncharacterized protein n=1 Tax=Salix viminalis TaxID=40686 RepID=A0A6N2M8H7_SALVM